MSPVSTPYDSSSPCDERAESIVMEVNSTAPTDEAELAGRRIRHAYYYEWLYNILRFVVRPGARVLHIGCECGDLLAAVKPGYGVGLDSDGVVIASARRRFPHLRFCVQDSQELDLDETFDYILIGDALGQWHDVQRVLTNLHKVATSDTRVIITYRRYLWAGIVRICSRLTMRRTQPHWLRPGDFANLLYLSGFEMVRTASYLMLPRRIPVIAPICNHVLSLLPGFQWLNLITLLIARPMPSAMDPGTMSVSVIVPSRNERGNIAATVSRIPRMGRETEIIFVDGGSTDGTVAEIEQQIREQPQRNIRLIHQGSITGKKDAVRKGFAAAKGDILVIQDADLTVSPEDIGKFFRAWCEGKGEFINGSRLVYPLQDKAMQYLNLLGNRFFGALFTWLLGQRFRDTLCGTKMISRRHYERIAADHSFFGDFDPFGDFDLIFGAGKQNLKIIEIPLRYHARTYGKTNIHRFRHGLLLLKMSWWALKRIKWLSPS